jgi:predicted transposase YdaD
MGDADITLRHITRQHPEDLARAFVPHGRPVEVVGWVDSQLTSLERRLDKALQLRVDGSLQIVQVEFFFRLDRDVGYRMFEYLAMLVIALHNEASDQEVPPIESVAVVLTGRKQRLPARGAFSTAWSGSLFSGARYRIEAVYQRTVAELRARAGVLWLVFIPLARDATAEVVREVVETVRVLIPSDDERADFYATFLVMAEIDPWGHNLWEEIAAMLERSDNELIMRSRTLREVFERGEKEGRKEGREEGREEAIRELLSKLFAQQIGRGLTAAEHAALVQRAHALGPEQVQAIVFKLQGDALAAWLQDPKAR